MENNVAPYLHWHTRCAACGKVTLARACNVPGPIDPIEHNPVIKCQHCDDVRQIPRQRVLPRSAVCGQFAGQVRWCAGLRRWIDRGSEAGQSGLTRDSEQEPSRPLDHLGLDHHCEDGRGRCKDKAVNCGSPSDEDVLS